MSGIGYQITVTHICALSERATVAIDIVRMKQRRKPAPPLIEIARHTHTIPQLEFHLKH